MTKTCLLCGIEKEDDELILCDECMEYFDMVQQAVLQSQLEEINKGIPK